mgnify:FL=1
MSTAYDYRRTALKAKGYFGQASDMLLSWARAGGARSKNVSEPLIEYFHINGAKSRDLEEAWTEIYHLSGLTGSKQEMTLSFWRDLEGNIPLNAIMGWTGKELCSE